MAVFALFIVYCNVYYFALRYLVGKEYASYILVLLIFVSGLVSLKGIAEHYFFQQAGIQHYFNSIVILDGLSNMVLFSVCIASTSAGFLCRQLLEDKTKIEHLKDRTMKNSIEKIKNNIQPAFLNATLNYTAEMVRYDSKKASDTLYKLSEHLRYQLYDSMRNTVLLASEIDFIKNYLSLYQQNENGGFYFNISIEGNSNRLIAPTTFMPCIETIINLGVKGLEIKFRNSKEQIDLRIHALIIPSLPETLKETIQRLKMIYDNHILVEEESNILKIHLKVC